MKLPDKCLDILDEIYEKKSFAYTPEDVDDLEDRLKSSIKRDGDINRVEICVLKWKLPEIEKKCVNNIIDYTTHPYKLTLFDNRLNPNNTSKVWNKLIREASCRLVLIMDSDIFVTEGWLEPLVEVFNKNKDAYIAVPVMGVSGTPFCQRLEKRDKDAFSTMNDVSGCCFLLDKKKFKEVGKFNENFQFYGQDSEYFERVQKYSPYEVYVVTRSLVRHGLYDGETGYIGASSAQAAHKAGEMNMQVDATYAGRYMAYLREQNKRTKKRYKG